MRIRVLGSAAGGGFPQWNCGCLNCRGVRSGTSISKARSQESVAVSADGESWFLLNASPEIRSQIEGYPPLHPKAARHSPIAGIVLTNGDLDHCLGLLSLRESQPLVIYATERVRRGFCEENRLYRTLERFEGQTTWRSLRLGERVGVQVGERPAGLVLEPFAVPGKPPIHLEQLGAAQPEDNIAVRVTDVARGRAVVYMPAIGAVSPRTRELLGSAECVFLDGTFWSADELVALGLGSKRAEDMAHLPMSGLGGSLEVAKQLSAERRIFIHVNNSNPVLRDDSPERCSVREAGCEIAFDGMELEL